MADPISLADVILDASMKGFDISFLGHQFKGKSEMTIRIEAQAKGGYIGLYAVPGDWIEKNRDNFSSPLAALVEDCFRRFIVTRRKENSSG